MKDNRFSIIAEEITDAILYPEWESSTSDIYPYDNWEYSTSSSSSSKRQAREWITDEEWERLHWRDKEEAFERICKVVLKTLLCPGSSSGQSDRFLICRQEVRVLSGVPIFSLCRLPYPV